MRMKKTLQFMGGVLLAATVFTSGAQAATHYSSLVVFGDSLSDSGNIATVTGTNNNPVISSNTSILGVPLGQGAFTNGEAWSTQFATMASLSLSPSRLGGTNFAHGSAGVMEDRVLSGFTVPSLPTQVNSYLASVSGSASSSGLYVIAGGGNDARDILSANALLALTNPTAFQSVLTTAAANYALEVGAMVDTLQLAGAQHIVVWNTPNIGITPAVAANPFGLTALGTGIANAMNTALMARLSGESGVQVFDIFGLNVLAQNQGFTHVADACGNTALACNSDLSHSLFFDGIHPTAAAHTLIATQMFALTAPVPEPSEMAMLAAGLVLVVTVVRRRRH